MYHTSDMCVRYAHACTSTSKNGMCKSELKLAGNVSFKGVSYVMQKTEGTLLTSKCANFVGT